MAVFKQLIQSQRLIEKKGLTSRTTHLETIFPPYLWTGAKHTAFSTNHLADTNKTKHNNQKQHKKSKQHKRKLLVLTYLQTKANKTKAWFRGLLCHLVRKFNRLVLQLPEPARGVQVEKKQITGLIYKM